jgi:YVTN family beta-propeller protein
VSGGSFKANVVHPNSIGLSSSFASVGTGPEGIAISPGGNLLYVANAGANPNTMTIIEVSTQNTQTITITPPQFFSSSFASVVANPNGQFVYVSLNDGYGVIDPANNFALTKHSCCVAPAQLAVSPDGLRLYVADGANKLVIIDTTTHQVIKTYDSFPPGQILLGAAAHPDGTRVYMTAPNTDMVFVVDTGQDTIGAIALPANSAPFGIAISPDGLAAYVSLYSANAVGVIDTATNTVSTIVALKAHKKNPGGLAVSPDGKAVYVALRCDVIGPTCPILGAGNNEGISIIDTTKSPPTASDVLVLNYSVNGVVFSPGGANAFVTAQRNVNDNKVFSVP